MGVIETVAVGGVVGVGLLVRKLVRVRKRRARLALAAELLGGGHNGVSVAEGAALGPEMSVAFKPVVPPSLWSFALGEGRADLDHFTEITARLPDKIPLSLSVRRRTPLDGDAAFGSLTDVDFGDEAFAGVYRVAAAPIDVARYLLNDELRAYLRLLGSAELQTSATSVCLTIARWLDDQRALGEAVRAVAFIANNVRAAYEHLERAAPAVPSGSPYRPEEDESERRLQAAKRDLELGLLRKLGKRGPSN